MALPEVLQRLDAPLRKRIRPAPAGFVEPMRAKLTDGPFSRADWVYERKFDGERILAVRKKGRVTLFTRNRKNANAPYPELVEALEGMQRPSGDFVIDGEVVAFDDDGQTSFALLQRRMQKSDPRLSMATGVAVDYYVFDVVNLAGSDVTRLPLRHRKEILRDAFDLQGPVSYSDHREEHGEAYLEAACAAGWEGLIAKRADASYQTKRSSDWLKFKCVTGQEFVIGGYTPPKGTRIAFGALLLGYHENGRFRYAGKVGTGFNAQLLRNLHEQMMSMRRPDPPFDEPVAEREAVWIEPRLICEVGFTEWTEEGRLRHPRFKGLRRDKPPEKIVREDLQAVHGPA